MGQKPLIIGICGGTGAGKTTITNRITQTLSVANVIILEQDITIKIFRTYHSPSELSKILTILIPLILRFSLNT